MCGIVGYVGNQNAQPILIEGLKRLEYRGYDSAGFALSGKGKDPFTVVKKTGRVDNLIKAAAIQRKRAHCGISHTRWATHGGVNDCNAHPHLSSDGMICLVHNGVIENHAQLRRRLEERGFTFQTETDTEALANLIAFNYQQLKENPGLLETDQSNGNGSGHQRSLFDTAVRISVLEVEGTYGIAVLCKEFPEEIIGARKGSPLVLGVGKEDTMIASDITAFAGRMQNVVYLDDGQFVHLRRGGDFSIATTADEEVSPVISEINWKVEDAELGPFPHFMLKEIFEQPMSLQNAQRGRFSADMSTAQFGGLNMSPREIRQIDRILFLACGTAWHACLVAEHLIERYARIPVEVEYASEFRYRNAPLDKNTLVFVVSQSGETLDTLEALREARRKGYRTLGIINVVGSTIARENDGGIYQHSGPEIGVASTKAFTAQCLITSMLALYFGRMRDLSYAEGKSMVKAMQAVPGLVNQILEQSESIKTIAHKYAHCEDFLFLGRQAMHPIALEGALKLKEISYIHAEGYPAAEMKHGPIALICEKCPTVAMALRDEIFHKSLANIQEIKARKGPVIAVTDATNHFPDGLADEVIYIPEAHPCVQPVLAVIPLQLLSYHMAVARGCDVDKPRNLAKSVTVE